MDQAALTIQENPLAALELCEARITNAIRRALEATVDVGQALQKIAEERLYEARGTNPLPSTSGKCCISTS